MEEKERYKYYEKINQIYDKINDELYCLGIEQDKIKLVDFLNLMDEDWWALYERNKELRRENEQLKQSQKELAIDVLEQLHNDFGGSIGNGMLRTYVCGLIKDKISELKGEE